MVAVADRILEDQLRRPGQIKTLGNSRKVQVHSSVKRVISPLRKSGGLSFVYTVWGRVCLWLITTLWATLSIPLPQIQISLFSAVLPRWQGALLWASYAFQQNQTVFHHLGTDAWAHKLTNWLEIITAKCSSLKRFVGSPVQTSSSALF